ncbi:MAG: hypothetical protein HKO86_04620 [Gammaproteobacteria bacterium]|nr:hypothetical protein [Gammaproteobacteria bacterium]NNL06987.1 hypothetical protein [Gammaproteobacteria bacterium]
MFGRWPGKERPLRDVPPVVYTMLIITLLLQLYWHGQQQEIIPRAEDLPRPMSAEAYVLSSFGEPVTAAKVLNLWLQAFDNQPGISIPLHALDYGVVTDWLDTILELDPHGHYPMLVAARVYGSVSDRDKQRVMMDYIYSRFKQDPNRYWRWLAHAVITAKHELRDMPLALKYADALAEKATAEHVPYWARDMRIIVLEDMGEIEAAKVLVGALITSGEITDPHELRFLENKIRVLEQKLTKSRQDVDK